LYMIIDAMYDKTLIILWKSNRDIMDLEKWVFAQNWITKELLEWIMIKRRNLIFLKHNFIFQWELLEELQKGIEKFYEWKLDLYFEDLAYKLDKIDNNIDIQSKNINSLTEAYNSLTNIKLNSILTKLTIFTFIIWTLTLIAWLYWMNIPLPMETWQNAFGIITILMIILSMLLIILFRKRGWFE
jgi:magnesium transporter